MLNVSVLFCKYGPLCHGSREIIEQEKKNYINRFHKDESDFWIEEFDYLTHQLVDGSVVKRATPLELFSADELYSLTETRKETNLYGWNINTIFPDIIHQEDEYKIQKTSEGTIEVKFVLNKVINDEFYYCATFWFNNVPFMVAYNSTNEFYNNRRFITNFNCYTSYVNYMNSLLLPEIKNNDIVNSQDKLPPFDFNI